MAAHVKPLKEGVLTCLMCGNEKSFSNVMDNSDTLNLAELANATIKDVV